MQVRNRLFFQFFLNGKADFFQQERFSYIRSRTQILKLFGTVRFRKPAGNYCLLPGMNDEQEEKREPVKAEPESSFQRYPNAKKYANSRRTKNEIIKKYQTRTSLG